MRAAFVARLLSLALVAGAGAQTTVTIQPSPVDSKDASIASFFAGRLDFNAVFGSCYSSGVLGVYRSFHQYDLSSIPPGATILSATHNIYLTLYCTPDSQPMAAYRVLAPWSEATISWATQPAHDASTPYGTRLAGNPATSPVGYNAWDVTGLVQLWVSNPGSNRGLVMRAVDESTYAAAVGGISGESPPGVAPYLEVTYTGGGAGIGDDQAVVVNRGTGALSVIDATTMSVLSTVGLGTDLIDVAVTPDGMRAIATSFFDQRVTIVNLTSSPPTVLGSFSVPILAEDVSVSCTDDIALITDGISGTDNRVVSVDMGTHTVVQTLFLPVAVQGVDVSPDGTLAIVVSTFTDTARVLTVSPGGALTDTGQSVAVGSNPLNVTFAPNGRSALVANGGGTVSLLGVNGTTVTNLQTLAVPVGPQSIAYAPDGSRAFVMHCAGEIMTVLDTSTAGSVALVASHGHGGPNPSCYFGVDQVAVTTDGTRVLARAFGEVAVFDAGTSALLGSIPVGNDGGIAVRCQPFVDPNVPPDADAGLDRTLECTSGGTVVTLDGSNSSDADGDALSYEWVVASGTATIASPNSATTTATITGIGPVMFTLTVSDGNGGIDSDDVVITVKDTTPPVIVATTDCATLWPPNHSLVPVMIGLQVDENCDPNNLVMTCEITSSEPDDSTGDGFFAGDVRVGGVSHDAYSAPVAVTLDPLGGKEFGSTVELRAERDGGGASRSYSIVCTVTDSSGNKATASCVVVVPHDRRSK